MFNSDSAYSNCSIAQVTVQTRNKITTYNTNHNDQHIISEQTTMTTSWNQPLWGKFPATSSWRSSASYRTTWYEILRDIMSIMDPIGICIQHMSWTWCNVQKTSKNCPTKPKTWNMWEVKIFSQPNSRILERWSFLANGGPEKVPSAIFAIREASLDTFWNVIQDIQDFNKIFLEAGRHLYECFRK